MLALIRRLMSLVTRITARSGFWTRSSSTAARIWLSALAWPLLLVRCWKYSRPTEPPRLSLMPCGLLSSRPSPRSCCLPSSISSLRKLLTWRPLRDFRGAFLLFVEFLQYGHRDEDVVFLETEQRGRVMQQDVGIESVDALASGHAEVSSLVGGKRWRTKAMESGRSAGGNGVEHGPGMAGHFHATPFGRQLAVRVDQEGAAHDAHEALAVQDLLVDHVERAAPGFVGIGHEREGQFLLRGEVGVRLLRIARHADDLRVALAE